jgi:isopenicillin N synthase-like dioxygenase
MGTFRTMLELPADDPDVLRGKPMHAPNHWPDHLPGFREIVTAYQDAMLALSVHIRQMFAIGLDLPEDFFEPFYRRPLIQQSLLYYPAPPSTDPKDLKIGAGEHSDTGAFTILMQDRSAVWRSSTAKRAGFRPRRSRAPSSSISAT